MKAVIANDSERVHATKGKPCFEAGLQRSPPTKWITTPSLIVKPCALFTVKAYPPVKGNCSRLMRVQSFRLYLGKIGTHFGSWFVWVEGWTTIVWEVHDDRLWEAPNTSRPVRDTYHSAPRTIGKTVKVSDIARQHHLAPLVPH